MAKSLTGCANTSQLGDILELLNNVVKRSGKSPQAVELNWMTSLLLKSLYLILQVRGYGWFWVGVAILLAGQ